MEAKVNPESPRTLQIMNRLGLTEDQVTFKLLDEFREYEVAEQTAVKRYRMHLKRVHANIKEVIAEKKKRRFMEKK